MAEPRLDDAAARERAATDFETNLVVLAGAGTGKTSLLVERLLVALGSGAVTLDRVAALTFTEKASAEMRERLARGCESLAASARGEPPPGDGTEAGRAWSRLAPGHAAATVAERALAALDAIDAARIGTIHTFCSELLRAHPREAGVDPDFAVDRGEFATRAFEEDWRAELAERFAEDGPDAGPEAARWTALLERLPLGTLRQVAAALAGFGIDGSALETAAAADLAPLRHAAGEFAAEIERCLAAGRAYSKTGVERSGLLAGLLRVYEREGIDALRRACAAAGDDYAHALSRTLSMGSKVDDVEKRELADAYATAKRLLEGLAATDAAFAGELATAMAPLVARHRRGMLGQGQVGFDGLLHLARDLLRDHPSIRDRYKRRFRMLLIDEFQDTDPLQYEIVLFLAGRPGATTADAYDERLEPGRLFIVGDAKQSIYRFRGADFDAFRRAVRTVEREGGAVLDLTSNFRSDRAILRGINDLFASDLGGWDEGAYQPPYVALSATRDGERERPIEIWTVADSEGENADARRRLEAGVLAHGIAEAVREDGVDYDDCVVVLRAMTRVDLYTRALRAAGIPFVVDGGRSFLERTEVTQFLAALTVAVRPADEAAWLALLRSPAGGIDDRELTAYADDGGSWRLGATPDAARFATLARRFDERRALVRAVHAMAPGPAVGHVLRTSRLLELHAAGFEGAQRVANLRKLAATVAARARDGRLTLAEAVDEVRRGRAEDLGAESPLSDDATVAVRILTVHKVKGLEAKVVFVPDFARDAGARGDAPVATLWRPAGERPHLALHAGGLRNEAAVAAETENRRHDAAESHRVLYVALTRARERLVLIHSRGRRLPPWQRALAAWGYDAADPPGDGPLAHPSVRHRTVDAAETTAAAARAARIDPGPAVAAWGAAVERLRTETAGFATPSGHDDGPPRDVRDGDAGGDADGDGATGRAVGAVVHRALESGARGDALREVARRIVREEAAARRVAADALHEATRELLDRFLDSPLAALRASVDVVGVEVPLLLRDADGTRWRGSIDLLYRDADGETVVADYKTDRDDAPERLVARHGPQLRVYARAVRQALGLDREPRAEIWALRRGERIAVPR